LTAIEFAQNSYLVVATMRDLGRGSRLEEAAPKANVRERVDIRQLDVTAFASIPATIDTIVKDHGRIDLLVNNAGFSMSGFAEDMSLDELRRQFDANFFGVVAVSKAVISLMRQQKSGHIIQVASVAGRVGNPLLSAYGSSKFALEGWSESLRMDRAYSAAFSVLLLVFTRSFRCDHTKNATPATNSARITPSMRWNHCFRRGSLFHCSPSCMPIHASAKHQGHEPMNV
jgi:NAD(P)-dependent dehydrogenase (short-subunit alcohol dehydrogenase family)